MSVDTKKGVPGVPLAALDAIQDTNTRDVLRAIVDGWHVRNGSSGAGDNRFVTAAELGDLSGRVVGFGKTLSGVQQQVQDRKVLTSGEISRIITDLQASVMESVLFKELGDRITLIDLTAAQSLADGLLAEATARGAAITQEANTRQAADSSLASQITTVTAAVGQNAAAIQAETTARVNGDTAEANARLILAARVGDAESAIVAEQTARTNGDNAITSSVNTQFASVNGNLSALQTQQTNTANSVAALSQSLTTLQATVGDNTLALQTEAITRINADNDIYAKYSVKIDNNGYVTGYGLMSTANNSVPFSEFIVRADRFAIGSPTGPGITPEVPFIVLTTTDSRGNGPGVYIDRAMIKNADIGTAQIDDLAVNTLKIAGNAVTVPVGSNASGGFPAHAVVLNEPGKIFLTVTGNFLAQNSGSNTSIYVIPTVNGVDQVEVGTSFTSGFSGAVTASCSYTASTPGTYWVGARWYWNGTTNYVAGVCSTFAIGIMR